MAKQIINTGSSANAGDGEGLRDAFIKVNNNFDEVYLKVDQGSIVTSGLTTPGAGILGRSTGSTDAPIQNLTATQAKTFLALENVNNTSDADKPISTATATALNGKAGVTHTHVIADVTGLQTSLDAKASTSHSHVAGDIQLTSGPRVLGKSTPGAGAASELTDVDLKGLLNITNVNNTSDANKPISTATQTALNLKLNTNGTIAISQVTSLQLALDGKASAAHAHVIADVSGLQTALDGKANLSEITVGYTGTTAADTLRYSLNPSMQGYTISVTNSRVRASQAATVGQTRDIEKNGVVIGTVTWTAGALLGTISIPVVGDRTIAYGDHLAIVATAPPAWSANLVIILRN